MLLEKLILKQIIECISMTIIQFFREYQPNIIDSRLGLLYADIIDQLFKKVLLYMEHVIRYEAQNIRIKEIS